MLQALATQSDARFSRVLLRQRHLPSGQSCPSVVCSIHAVYNHQQPDFSPCVSACIPSTYRAGRNFLYQARQRTHTDLGAATLDGVGRPAHGLQSSDADGLATSGEARRGGAQQQPPVESHRRRRLTSGGDGFMNERGAGVDDFGGQTLFLFYTMTWWVASRRCVSVS